VLTPTTPGKLHWNYFLALERDLEVISRFVELSTANEAVYSIELARLLFGAASEVDVVAKLVCAQVAPAARCGNIEDYRSILSEAIPDLPQTEVFVPRYGFSFKPWDNWTDGRSPDWWRAYNKVKHERDSNYHQATLKHALNSLGGLLLLCFHYYARALKPADAAFLSPKEATRQLLPESTLLRLHDSWYYSRLLV
jgi:hypothetical protein